LHCLPFYTKITVYEKPGPSARIKKIKEAFGHVKRFYREEIAVTITEKHVTHFPERGN